MTCPRSYTSSFSGRAQTRVQLLAPAQSHQFQAEQEHWFWDLFEKASEINWKLSHISREKWLSLPVFSLVLPTLKKKMMKGEEKRFIHSFKADVKIPENISNHLSYSLGQVIRPSILIKRHLRSKISARRKAQKIGLKGTPKQNKNNPSHFPSFHFLRFFLFFAGVL